MSKTVEPLVTSYERGKAQSAAGAGTPGRSEIPETPLSEVCSSIEATMRPERAVAMVATAGSFWT